MLSPIRGTVTELLITCQAVFVKKKKKKKRQMKAGGKINNSTWWQSKTGRLEEREKKSHFFPFHPLSHTEAVVIRERRGGREGEGGR